MPSVINDSIGSFTNTSDNQTITGTSYTLPSNCSVKGNALIVATDSNGNVAVIEKIFSAKRASGNAFIVGNIENAYPPIMDEALSGINFSVDGMDDDIRSRISGLDGVNISWRCEMNLKIIDFSNGA